MLVSHQSGYTYVVAVIAPVGDCQNPDQDVGEYWALCCIPLCPAALQLPWVRVFISNIVGIFRYRRQKWNFLFSYCQMSYFGDTLITSSNPMQKLETSSSDWLAVFFFGLGSHVIFLLSILLRYRQECVIKLIYFRNSRLKREWCRFPECYSISRYKGLKLKCRNETLNVKNNCYKCSECVLINCETL